MMIIRLEFSAIRRCPGEGRSDCCTVVAVAFVVVVTIILLLDSMFQ